MAIPTNLKLNAFAVEGVNIPTTQPNKLICADLPNTQITLSKDGQVVETKTTDAVKGGIVEFVVSANQEYTIQTPKWTNTITTKTGENIVKVPQGLGLDETYGLNLYTFDELATIAKNGYFSIMFDVKYKYNFKQAGSILNDYDFFVEEIEKVGDGEQVYFRLCNPHGGESINDRFSYLSDSGDTSFASTRSADGGYKYSKMRKNFMKQGETIYSQATSLKPTGSSVVGGIEFDKLYYTDTQQPASIFNHDYKNDIFTIMGAYEYGSTTRFVKGYFKNVGAIDESTFNSGKYYTLDDEYNGLYSSATTYSSGTTYYGFYEFLQENGKYLDALSSISSNFLMLNDLSHNGYQSDSLTLETNDLVDIPTIEETTGTSKDKVLFSSKNKNSTSKGSSISSYNFGDEGTKRSAYNEFDLQATGKSFWSRSAYIGSSSSWCDVYNNGFVSNDYVDNIYGVRVGFKIGKEV